MLALVFAAEGGVSQAQSQSDSLTGQGHGGLQGDSLRAKVDSLRARELAVEIRLLELDQRERALQAELERIEMYAVNFRESGAPILLLISLAILAGLWMLGRAESKD